MGTEISSLGINSYSSLKEKLAFINGYLNCIAILNTNADNAMEHWMIDLGIIDGGVIQTIKKGINAPNWTFKATEIPNWEEKMADDLFFSSLIYYLKYRTQQIITTNKDDMI